MLTRLQEISKHAHWKENVNQLDTLRRLVNMPHYTLQAVLHHSL